MKSNPLAPLAPPPCPKGSNGGITVGSNCFCPFGYSGSLCNTGPSFPSLSDSSYPCDLTVATDDPSSCTQFVSSVNLYGADPLTKRITYSNYDDKEFGRLMEPENPLVGGAMMITISEHEVLYLESIWSSPTYNIKVKKYDYRTSQISDIVTTTSSYDPAALRKSRYSEHFYLVLRYSVEKYDFEGTH